MIMMMCSVTKLRLGYKQTTRTPSFPGAMRAAAGATFSRPRPRTVPGAAGRGMRLTSRLHKIRVQPYIFRA